VKTKLLDIQIKNPTCKMNTQNDSNCLSSIFRRTDCEVIYQIQSS